MGWNCYISSLSFIWNPLLWVGFIQTCNLRTCIDAILSYTTSYINSYLQNGSVPKLRRASSRIAKYPLLYKQIAGIVLGTNYSCMNARCFHYLLNGQHVVHIKRNKTISNLALCKDVVLSFRCVMKVLIIPVLLVSLCIRSMGYINIKDFNVYRYNCSRW